MNIELQGHEFSLAVSVAIGALHALEPGHGKTAVIAHLLTEKRSFLKPSLIASTTAITHATSIFFTAMIAHGLMHSVIDSEASMGGVYLWLNLLSGLVLIMTAFFLLSRRKANLLKVGAHQDGACSCGHNHLSKLAPVRKASKSSNSWRTIAVGFAAGLVPCPSALVALSSAMTAHNWVTAIILICAFSLGIFIALLTLGLLLGFHGQTLLKRFTSSRNPNFAFQIQGVVVAVAGAWHLWTALSGHGMSGH